MADVTNEKSYMHSTFWTTSDCDIPVTLWRERLGRAADRIVLAPGLEHNLRAYPGGKSVPNDLESARGFAAAAWHGGADQIYLFNFMDSDTIPVSESEYRKLLHSQPTSSRSISSSVFLLVSGSFRETTTKPITQIAP